MLLTNSPATAHQQAAFRALADPSRRQMLLHLSEQAMTIGQMVDRFSMTRAAVRKHLTVLEQGNLVSIRVRGRERITQLDPEGLTAVKDWLDNFDKFRLANSRG